MDVECGSYDEETAWYLFVIGFRFVSLIWLELRKYGVWKEERKRK
jgi:hypothetical protein